MSTILYDANPPMFRNNPLLFIACLLLIAVFGIGILCLLYWYVLAKSKRLVITDQEVRYEEGILSKSRVELGITKVRSLRVNQTLFQRMFGTGDVAFYSAGDAPEFTVSGLPDPHTIREIIES